MEQISKERFLELQGESSDWKRIESEGLADFHYQTKLVGGYSEYYLLYTTQPDAKGNLFSSYYVGDVDYADIC